MSLYKRGSTWWIDFTTPAGKRTRRSAETGSKVEAQELHDKLKAAHWRVDVMEEKPQRTWDDAAYQWLRETGEKRTHKDDLAKIAWLHPFLRGKGLAEITREDIIAISERKRGEASAATANRYLALLRAILRRACNEWEWIDKVPKVKLYREPRRRVRWITPEQVQALLAQLQPYQRATMLFALATGLRQSNVQRLAWATVDLARRTAWIPADQAKGGDDIHVSLSDFAVELLRRQLGQHPQLVFTRDGRPIGQINSRSWRAALRRAGIENFRWHDLRHTWASWLIQNGTPLFEVQEMGGWKSAAMVWRYAHLAPANLANRADIVGNILRDTITPQGDTPPE